MAHKFAIMHRTERWNKEAVLSAIDCILEPLSQHVQMEASVFPKESGDVVDITITFDIRGVR